MTVDELIVKLQVMSHAGHGNRVITIPDYDNDLNSEFHVLLNEDANETTYYAAISIVYNSKFVVIEPVN